MLNYEVKQKLEELKNCEFLTIGIMNQPYRTLEYDCIVNLPQEESVLLKWGDINYKYSYSEIICIEQTP